MNYKTQKHAEIHGLPIDETGKTPKTEANVLAFRDSIVQMPEREKIVWFDDGGYQKGTERGYDSVNLYDPETRVIVVFKKEGNGNLSRFTTTCNVTILEGEHLFQSGGNFVTEANLK